ncbi:hypothetical protein Ancab_035150 [Ancistrocladus abbreviatus]
MASLICLTPIFLFATILLILYLNDHYDHFFSNTSSSFLVLYFKTTNHRAPPVQPPAAATSSWQNRKKKSGLQKIEEDLARARAMIHRAVRDRRYFSDEAEAAFVPRGSIYWNSYAFHQSHIEMVKRFKVWTYKEGEQPVVHNGPLKDIYAIEGQLIHEMESGLSPFRAPNPDEAHVFFLPFSVAYVIEYIYRANGSLSTYARDPLQHFVADYVAAVANRHPYWNRSHGADHFMVSCHDWAPDISNSSIEFNKFMRVICNANRSETFEPKRDVSMPEIYVPAENLPSIHQGGPPNNRPILAFFAGGAHGDIRELLLKYWKHKDTEIQVHEYLEEGQNYTKLMGRSKYCLCPSGFEVASPRIVEAIYAGCVPVIMSRNYTLPFSDVLNWSQFSIEIPVEKIPEIKNIFERSVKWTTKRISSVHIEALSQIEFIYLKAYGSKVEKFSRFSLLSIAAALAFLSLGEPPANQLLPWLEKQSRGTENLN